jgi:CDP-glycerol glycerophosphotransferase (TagB/SpsB family)
MNVKKVKLRALQLFVLIKYIIIFCICKLFRIKNECVWLISERGDEARDNGFAFYKYLKKNKPKLNVKYVISKNSPDLNKIECKDDIVYLRSFQHYILFITAGKLISTHIMGFSPEMRLFNKLESKYRLHIKGKRIFLQHGITQNHIDIFNPKRINIDLFICGAKPEYDYLLKTSGFTDKILKYTGFVRYDFLKSNPKNTILIMPTWRTTLFYCKNINEFKNSLFFKKWYELLNNKKLNMFLEKNNYKVLFYPHYEMQSFVEAFDNDMPNVIIASKEQHDVQSLLNECSLLVTDYSSVFFDVAYLKKPSVYFQFDYNEFVTKHYKEGWFNHRKNGFGPVAEESAEVVKYIIKYCKANFKIEDKYMKNIDSVFVYNDCKNSERVYNEIIRL